MTTTKRQKYLCFLIPAVIFATLCLLGCVLAIVHSSSLDCPAWSNCYDCASDSQCKWFATQGEGNSRLGECRSRHSATPSDQGLSDTSKCYQCETYTSCSTCLEGAPLCAFCGGKCHTITNTSYFQALCSIDRIETCDAKPLQTSFTIAGALCGLVLSVLVCVYFGYSAKVRDSPLNVVLMSFAVVQIVISVGVITRFVVIASTSVAPTSFWHYEFRVALDAAGLVNDATLGYIYFAMLLCIRYGDAPAVSSRPWYFALGLQIITILAFCIAIGVSIGATTSSRSLRVIVPAVFVTLSAQITFGIFCVCYVGKKVTLHLEGEARTLLLQRCFYLGILIVILIGLLVFALDPKLLRGEVEHTADHVAFQLGLIWIPVIVLLWFLATERAWTYVKLVRGGEDGPDPEVFTRSLDAALKKLHNGGDQTPRDNSLLLSTASYYSSPSEPHLSYSGIPSDPLEESDSTPSLARAGDRHTA